MYLPDADYADEAQKHADFMCKINIKSAYLCGFCVICVQ